MRINYWEKLEPEICYHIYNRCISDSLLFLNEENYRFFLKKWWKYLGKYLTTYAYCLIPNHFHFLVKCKTPSPEIRTFIETENTSKSNQFLAKEIPYNTFLESQFKRFFTSYVNAFNKQHDRRGTLLQSKFKRVAIQGEEHFRFMLLYLHHNSIHHNLGKEYEDWLHSSYHDYVENKEVKIARDIVLHLFSDENDKAGLNNFLKFHQKNKNGLGGYPNLIKMKKVAIDF